MPVFYHTHIAFNGSNEPLLRKCLHAQAGRKHFDIIAEETHC